MVQIETAILATLTYSDIFDYPLTKAELWRYLICKKRIKLRVFENALQRAKKIKSEDKFFYLSGHQHTLTLRKKRQKISQKKILQVKKIVNILQKIPTIEFIGISGSVAMQNAEKNADIDLFLLTKPNTLWLTRLCVLSLLHLKKVRRNRNQKIAANAVCVNMLLDTAHMKFPKIRQDVYTAHEIIQMKPIFIRNDSYRAFLQKNSWVEDFLPNAFPKSSLMSKKSYQRRKYLFILPVEKMAKNFQLWYMRNHRTQETVSTGFVAFHPFDYRNTILSAWEKKKKQYGI